MFNPKEFSDWFHRLAATNNTNEKPWFNIKMSEYPCVVRSVIFINKENCYTLPISLCYDKIIGAELYVGYNHNPMYNVGCQAYPYHTGVYNCKGLVGTHLGIGFTRRYMD